MECAQIPVTTYTEFSKRLHNKMAEQRIPVGGSIEVTARCNLRCVHCYINLPFGDNKARERELKTTEWFSLIDQIAEEGCLWLLLTGGEPFIRPDFLDIYTYAKKKGLLIALFTNGTTITPHIADYLSEWRPFSIEVTLYGSTKETYENITGVHGSYERCMRGIDLIMNRDLPIKLKSMIMTLNKHEVWDMKKYAERLGTDFRYDPLLNMRLDGDQKPENFRITAQEVVEMDFADEKRMQVMRDSCEKFFGPPPRPEYLYQCGAGKISFHIDSSGLLSACMLSRLPNFDLHHGCFRDGWHVFLSKVLEQKWSQDTPCKKCDLISLCGQCPGWAQMEHDDQEKQVAYLCQIARRRAKAFGLKYLETGGKQ